MFPSPLCAHFVLLIVYAAVVSAAPPTDAPPESLFAIASPPSSRPTFSSGSVNYDPTHATNLEETVAFSVLTSGKSTSVTHDLPATYSFSQAGAGDDSIKLSNAFTYGDADDTHRDLHATVGSIAKVKPSGDLVVPRQTHNKRIGWWPGGSNPGPNFAHCSDEQKTIIQQATADAQRPLANAIAESKKLEEGPSADLGNYETWFGEYSKNRAYTVRRKLEGIGINLPFSGFTYDCNCNEVFPSEILADRKIIRICRPYWDLIPDDQSAQLVRMAGRRMPNIHDYAIGLEAARFLVIESPPYANMNLDNFVAFIWKKGDPLVPPYNSLPPPYDSLPPSYDSLPPPYSEEGL